MELTSKIRRGLARLIGDPKILLSLLHPRQLKTILRLILSPRSERRLSAPWRTDPEADLQRRDYQSYDSYVKHQSEKLESLVWMPLYDSDYHDVLRDRLRSSGAVAPGISVLCLAARLGTEVRAFHDIGCFAVGIDLNPGKDNRYVLPGDFHHVQFPEGSVDAVFTNSMDHAFDLERMIDEMERVLKADGALILEIDAGSTGGRSAKYFESIHWRSVDEVLDRFERRGFVTRFRAPFDYPWPGDHVILRRDHD